jgi:hypothetical protein
MRRITNKKDRDHLDKKRAFERRSIGRTKIAKGALLLFAGQVGARSCAIRATGQRKAPTDESKGRGKLGW